MAAAGMQPIMQGVSRPVPKSDELVPNLNNYVRGKLSKTEGLTFADCARAVAEALNSTDGSAQEVVSKVLSRITLFGSLPPSTLPMLVSVRTKVDLPKTADRKLLRVVNYLIQLASGEGSAGTVVPFSTLIGQSPPPTATDVFDYDALDPVWADVKSETVTHYQRAAAFRALAALARSSLNSDPDDLTLVSHLMAAVATTLDRCEAARRRKLPFGIGQGSKRAREMDRRQTLERVAAQRAALSASRTGLPGFVLSSKIAPRAFGGVNSPDAACARHALAVAAVAARDMPAMYVEQMGQFVMNTLEIYKKTGSLGAAEQAAAMAAAAADGMPAPLRPTKELYQEKSLNLSDDWARLYLARGCGAVVHAGAGNSAPFWEMLVLLACRDKSIIVALEAIKALAGAPYPTASTINAAAATSSPAPGSDGTPSSRRVLLPDEHVEADARLRFSMAWNLLMAHADDDAPTGAAVAAAVTAGPTGGFTKQFTISRTQRAVQESASLRRLASLGSEAGPGRAAAGETGASSSTTVQRRSLFNAIVSRLLTCLSLMSHAAICSAIRVVVILAESRAHALAAARTPADIAAVHGDEEVQQLMQQLEQRMAAIASDAGFSAHQREKALEALLWFSQLPPGRHAAPLMTPKQIMQWMSSGGGTVTLAVRAIFADPWPEDVIASFMLALSRRLLSAPAAASFLLSCATAVATATPSRVKQEQLHAMWDVCLRANVPEVKLAGLQAALSLMCAPTPAIAAPPSAAAPEVKALASREEAAMIALSRSAAWWLGENANFGTGEYVWQSRALPEEISKQLEAADNVSQQQLAAAAVAINPLLAMLIARLQRVMVTGLWEVRIAAAQALAKIAVRSGEPFRVQCYSILATAAAGSIAHRSRSSSRGSTNTAAVSPGNKGQEAAAAAAVSAAMQGAAADPLGIAAVAGPVVEVLDHMYAGELVVDQLMIRYGPRRSKWPKKLLRTLEKRNAALVAAIIERLCYVPKEHFWPLGNVAKELITGTEEDDEETKKKKKAEKEAKEAAEKAAAAEEDADKKPEEQQAAGESNRKFDPESPRAADRSKADMLDKLQGYDYDPNAPPEDLEYPDDSVSQIDYTDDEQYKEAGAYSDDDSDILLHKGVALYDFSPEEEDEVAISKGESVDIEYEVGGWLQIIKSDGSRGLVPKSYVLIKEEDEDSDAFSVAAGSSAVGQQTQAEGAADYNSFLARSSMRLRRRTSTADSETSSSVAYDSLRRRQQSHRHRASIDDGQEDEAVDAMTMSRMVAQVAQQGGEVDRALEQVDELDAVIKSAGTFNQPQYLHLKEALNAVINNLEQLQVSGDARSMRRQMVDRALTGLDKLESMRRYVMAGGSANGAAAAAGGSPQNTPRQPTAAQSLAAELPAGSDTAAGDLGAAGGQLEEDYQYVPSKVRVLFAFDAEAEGELSVAVGDSLWVETEVDGWYQVVRDGDGARGLVPATYVDVEQF